MRGMTPLPGTLMARLNVRGVELAKQLCEQLDVPYRQCGSLVLAFSPAECGTLETLRQRGEANGVPGLQVLTGDEARAMDPQLSDKVQAALYAPTAAICSPWEYCLALAETAVRNGAQLHLETQVTGMEKLAEGWLVHTDQGDFTARYVINAAGVSADAVHDLALPHDFSIRPSRGEYYLLDKSEGSRVSHTIFQCPNQNGKGVLGQPHGPRQPDRGPQRRTGGGKRHLYHRRRPGVCAHHRCKIGAPRSPLGSPSATLRVCVPMQPKSMILSCRSGRALWTQRASARRVCPPHLPLPNIWWSCCKRRALR